MLMYILIAALLGSMAFGIYWQSQIVIRARYKYTPVIFSILIGSWALSVPTMNWPFIILMAAFFTLNIMDGVGGIGGKRLVTNGLFSRVVDYSTITALKMVPVTLPNGKSRVIVLFVINDRQQIQMNFNQHLEILMKSLAQLLPDTVKIEVDRIE
ncbi:hypothetical protein [Lapidilactobacillus wuchangensis]|uniref:hypothetical protein n=1 Tax=Lapidilactobacillus wuchangensis TaxID=2486001 RepID=UPI000F77E744|nr:hypothetical protein [Lapidilactobacillus wuchangensis]